MTSLPPIQIKRIYDPPAEQDGLRVLVDRLWPRGVKKEDAQIDLWAKQVAPTAELRKWFNHTPDRFTEFRSRYMEELKAHADALRQIIVAAEGRTITLLYAARDSKHNHAVVLHECLSQQ